MRSVTTYGSDKWNFYTYMTRDGDGKLGIFSRFSTFYLERIPIVYAEGRFIQFVENCNGFTW